MAEMVEYVAGQCDEAPSTFERPERGSEGAGAEVVRGIPTIVDLPNKILGDELPVPPGIDSNSDLCKDRGGPEVRRPLKEFVFEKMEKNIKGRSG